MHLIRWVPLALLFAVSTASAQWKPADGPLMTPWAKDVSPENAWPEYPRPQMEREQWSNLNGLWDYAIRARGAGRPDSWDGQILVPFCVESALSGVMKRVAPDEVLWYHRTFSVPEGWDAQCVLLHFGAVDWEAQVWVNGERAGAHRGGYVPFSFDITELLKEGDNAITVRVWDPTDQAYQPRGKQVLKPEGIWYTPVSGIWQTVWLEPVPTTSIRSLKIVPSVESSTLTLTVDGSEEATVRVEARDGDQVASKAEGRTGKPLVLTLENPKPWSPENPHLYDLTVTLLQNDQEIDRVESYAGLRSISVKPDAKGHNRLFLNGEPLFQYGPLDQGWWPDGLYTAPTDEGLRYDIEVTKQLGFNMARKHVKIEPARWYYWCDKLGLLVWQDMPSGDAHPPWVREVDERGPELRRGAVSDENFRTELTALVESFFNHPSIVTWVPFNERWGQYDTAGIVALLRRLDPTRPINSASGGNFLGVGDILDVHSYPDPSMPRLDPYQAVVCGEFGGLGLPLEGHTWLDKGNWGYRSYESPESLTEAYLEKVAMLHPLIERGLAAAVYTQTTDVEIEVNGFMTYDRKVIKMDADTIAEANRRLDEIAEKAAKE